MPVEAQPGEPAEIAAILHWLEQRLLTTRGVRVQPPGNCVKPADANDLDDVEIGVVSSGGDPAGTRYVLLDRLVTQHTILRGLGVQFTQPSTVPVADPYSQHRVFLQVNESAPGGEPVEPTDLTPATARSSAYQSIPIDLWDGVHGLTALGLALRPGEHVRLFAERFTPVVASVATDFFIAARWKGWDYLGNALTDKADTFHAW